MNSNDDKKTTLKSTFSYIFFSSNTIILHGINYTISRPNKSNITGIEEIYELEIPTDEKTTPTKIETIKKQSTSWKPLSFIKDNFFPFISTHYKELILIGCLPLIYFFISRMNMLYRN